ncbi:MAG: efflux RND transporter periplasmic adaptor subunit [Planctomycetota bacterium]
MKTRPILRLLLSFLVFACSTAGCGPRSDVGENGASAASAEAEPEPVTVTLFGESVLLFMEHPRLVRGQDARFLAHFSVLATGEPIRTGRVVLSVGATTLEADGPKRDGLFIPEGSFPKAGRFPGSISVQSDQAVETLELGDVVVHATEEEARGAAEAGAGSEDAGDGVPFLMEQQWKVKLLLAAAGPARLVRRLVVPARVVLAEGAAAHVAAPVAGRLVAHGGGPLPLTGDHVEAGQDLAFVEPPLSLEWSLAAVQVERDLAAAGARLRFADLDHERVARLRQSGLSTQQQLDESARDLEVARGAAEAARAARARLDETRARSGPTGAAAGADAPRFALHAPIAGSVVGAGRVVGESVEAGDLLFRIVDPARLWVEGRVSEFDLGQLGEAPRAMVSLPALPGRRFEVGGTVENRLLAIGPEIDQRSRTAVIRYALADPDGAVMPGMLASLEIARDVVDAAVTIPVEAVVMDQGLPTVYVMAEGEMFERRDVELGLADGDLVEVLAGVEPGEHVATRGAGTVRMAAMSPASFGHGHGH